MTIRIWIHLSILMPIQKLEMSSLFLIFQFLRFIFTLLNSDPADQNQCGSGSETLLKRILFLGSCAGEAECWAGQGDGLAAAAPGRAGFPLPSQRGRDGRQQAQRGTIYMISYTSTFWTGRNFFLIRFYNIYGTYCLWCYWPCYQALLYCKYARPSVLV